jgi:hypothetical protein
VKASDVKHLDSYLADAHNHADHANQLVLDAMVAHNADDLERVEDSLTRARDAAANAERYARWALEKIKTERGAS